MPATTKKEDHQSERVEAQQEQPVQASSGQIAQIHAGVAVAQQQAEYEETISVLNQQLDKATRLIGQYVLLFGPLPS